MGSIAEEILRLQEAKLGIHNAIVDKGVEIPEGVLLDAYPDYIVSIPAGVRTYVAYASNSMGGGFSLAPIVSGAALMYRAEIHTDVDIGVPAASDFESAAWVKYVGDPGSNGITPVLSMGTVTTLSAGASATASMSGSGSVYMLSLGIPRGSDGQGGGTVTWGGIQGTLSSQTDLQSALNSKQDKIDFNNKLPYSNISETPTIGSGVLTISIGGTSVTFNANQTSNASVSIPTPGAGTLKISSGGSTYTFNANQSSNTTIDLGSGGGGGGSSTVYDLGSSGGIVSVNYANGDYQRLALTGDVTISVAQQNRPPVGCGMVVEVKNSGHAISAGGQTMVSSGTSGIFLIGMFNNSNGGLMFFKNPAETFTQWYD